MICDHLVIHVHTNKVFEERTVFLHFIDAGIQSSFLYIVYLCGFDKSHYSHHVIFVS